MSEMTLPFRHKMRIQILEVWDKARYFSYTEAPHNTEFYEWMGEKIMFLSNRRDRDTNPQL